MFAITRSPITIRQARWIVRSMPKEPEMGMKATLASTSFMGAFGTGGIPSLPECWTRTSDQHFADGETLKMSTPLRETKRRRRPWWKPYQKMREEQFLRMNIITFG